MALPLKGDPRRPLHLAASSCRTLGVLLIVLSTCATFPMLMGGINRRIPLFYIIVLAIYFVPGALFLICAVFMKRRQFWAVVVAMVLACVMELLLLVSMGTLLLGALTSPQSNYALIPAGICALFVAAFAQLIYHLAMSFNAIQYVAPEEQRGFEPLINNSAQDSGGEPPLPPPTL